MKAQFVILLFLLGAVASSVTPNLLWNQPPLEHNEASDTVLFERSQTASGVAAPRTFSAPSKSGFNFDSFAADDFYLSSYSQLVEIWIATAVDQLDSYTIDSVYIAIYPDVGGLPNYDPYSDTPAPVWSQSFEWASDDPDAEFPFPWITNPLRRGAIHVAVDVALQPGVYWLTMHYEISQSFISIPPATWLPGKTQGDSGSPARLYVPGDNPSAGSANAFGWYWNSLRRQGLGDLSFKFYGWSAPFGLSVYDAVEDQYFYRCPGQNSVLVNLTLDYFDTAAWNFSVHLTVILPEGSPLDINWVGNDTLSSVSPDTAFKLRYFTQGNDYQFTLNFTGYDGITWWLKNYTIRAVQDPLNDPEWVVRDEYGLVGGLFQWRQNSLSQGFQLEIDEDGGDFSQPELSVTVDGHLKSYRPTLDDYIDAGNISQFLARPQAFYVARIRAVNPSCNQTSNWVSLRFQSDECEMMSASFQSGTYNFKKGKFVTSSFLLNEYGTIMDFRVRVRGFHQRWSDVGLAVKTPVVHDGHTVDVPLFAEDCDLNWDSSDPRSESQHFEIFFAYGGEEDSLCPRPPDMLDPANITYIQPWGFNVFKQMVLGQDKRGTWALEWIDYGIGFSTNGKITDYDTLLCTIPVPPREHIIYKGESKVRRGTIALYGP